MVREPDEERAEAPASARKPRRSRLFSAPPSGLLDDDFMLPPGPPLRQEAPVTPEPAAAVPAAEELAEPVEVEPPPEPIDEPDVEPDVPAEPEDEPGQSAEPTPAGEPEPEDEPEPEEVPVQNVEPPQVEEDRPEPLPIAAEVPEAEPPAAATAAPQPAPVPPAEHSPLPAAAPTPPEVVAPLQPAPTQPTLSAADARSRRWGLLFAALCICCIITYALMPAPAPPAAVALEEPPTSPVEEPVAAEPEVVEPQPEPIDPTAGSVIIEGDAALVELLGRGQVFTAGEVPEGMYGIRVRFSEDDAPRLGGQVRIKIGETATVSCQQASLSCSVR